MIYRRRILIVYTVIGKKVCAESCRITQNTCIFGFRTGSLHKHFCLSQYDNKPENSPRTVRVTLRCLCVRGGRASLQKVETNLLPHCCPPGRTDLPKYFLQNQQILVPALQHTGAGNSRGGFRKYFKLLFV